MDGSGSGTYPTVKSSFLRRSTFRHSDNKFVSPLSIGIYSTDAHSMCSCINETYSVYVFKINLLTVRT